MHLGVRLEVEGVKAFLSDLYCCLAYSLGVACVLYVAYFVARIILL